MLLYAGLLLRIKVLGTDVTNFHNGNASYYYKMTRTKYTNMCPFPKTLNVKNVRDCTKTINLKKQRTLHK